MPSKTPRLSVYMRLSYKDRPDDFKGIYGEGCTIAKDEFVPLQEVLVATFIKIADFYQRTLQPTREEFIEEFEGAKIAVASLRLEERDGQE